MRTHVNCRVAVVLFFSAALGVVMAQPPKDLAIVNAAGGAAVVAPNSIASAFGKQIGASTNQARSLPLPTSLGNVSVSFMDTVKVARMAPLFYVAPNQINFVVPDGTAVGTATVTIMNGDTPPPTATGMVATVAPGLFTADGA